jgi:hypothetical protein
MGICATVGANLAHGVGHGWMGALVSAWPAVALVGSSELLVMLIRAGRGSSTGDVEPWRQQGGACGAAGPVSAALPNV